MMLPTKPASDLARAAPVLLVARSVHTIAFALGAAPPRLEHRLRCHQDYVASRRVPQLEDRHPEPSIDGWLRLLSCDPAFDHPLAVHGVGSGYV